jgi:hypothetical protein
LPAPVLNALFEAFTHFDVTARFFFANAQRAFGLSTPAQFLEAWRPYNLWGVRGELEAPLLVLITEDEIAGAPSAVLSATLDFLRGLRAPVSFRLFSQAEGGSAHCQLDSPERVPPVLFSWLDGIFGGAHSPSQLDLDSIARITELIEKHHGRRAGAAARDFQMQR